MNSNLSTLINSQPSSAIEPEVIDGIFEQLTFIYGAKFLDSLVMPVPETKKFWSAALSGLSDDELVRGINSMMQPRAFPPQVNEFLAMCRPQVDATRAYYEALEGIQARRSGEVGVWSHPAIYYAAMPLSSDLLSQTYSSVRPRWEAALANQLAKGQWDEIKKPVPQLAAPPKLATKKSADDALKVIGASEVAKKKPEGTDHGLWFKRILWRLDKGDKTVSMVQKQFAVQAANALGFSHKYN